MRASKSWNFDLEKPIKPIKMDSCVIFADHCMQLYILVATGICSSTESREEGGSLTSGLEIPGSIFFEKPK